MAFRRTTARAVLLAALLVAGRSAVASGHDGVPATAGPPPTRIVFPVVGKAEFSDDFGARRGQGGHQGNDILAERRAPLVAAEAGRVQLWTRSATAGCMLYLYGESGTTYLYVHLNDDLSARNDNRGGCVGAVAYARGLVDGRSVAAGELLGFVGDSGDADGRHPHLHFEIHPGGGGAVSPYRWLRRADRLVYPAAPSLTPGSLTLTFFGRLEPSSATDHLRLAASRVRLGTGETFAPRREVVFGVPASATIEHAGARPTTLDHGLAGDMVSVTTTVATPTLRTQIARPGTLIADRVVFLDPRP